MGCVTQIGEQGWNVARMSRARRRLARDRVRRRPSTASAAPRCRRIQRRRRDLVGPARRGRLVGRRDDVARADGLERRRPLREAGRALADRAAGDLGRGDRRRSGRSRARTLDAYSLESHRRAAAATDEGHFDNEMIPIELDEPARGRRVRRRRDAAPRHLRREARVAAARLRPGRPGDGRQLEPDRRRRRRDADHERARRDAARARAARPLRLVRPRRASIPYRMLHGNPQACAQALERAGLAGTTSP